MPVTNSHPGESGFDGLNHVDQRFAGTGAYTNSQFSLEPPDQGLCVGQGVVLEAVNNALVVYDQNGNKLTAVTALSQFFGLAPEVIRPSGPFGPFISDPKCYFDWQTNRWFLTELELATNPANGGFTGPSALLLAVSQGSSPTGTWTLYSLDATDDGTGGTPAHANCPCFGDQPLTGADSNGFYISTNEFPTLGPGFNGAQVYAMSKQGVESGESLTVVHIDTGAASAPGCGTQCWYTIQPAISPPGERYAKNTEYFASALDFFSTLDNRIAVWTLTGTDTLSESSPDISLQVSVLKTEVYGQPCGGFPCGVTQKNGPHPLGSAVGAGLEQLNANDDRMNQVVFAGGRLWGAVNTVVQNPAAPTVSRSGIAYFIIKPNGDRNGDGNGQGNGGGVTVSAQGYVVVSGESVLFPSIGVNSNGKAVMVFTLVGPDYFPSAAYAPIGDDGSVGQVHIAAAGVAPEDGFSGYAAFGSPTPGVARWGDYSAAVSAPDGSIWMATEFIPGPRTVLANWGTFVAHLSFTSED